MLVEEVAALFRSYTDESDTTYMTSANVALYLKLGYAELRGKWARVDPSVYETIVNLPLAGVTEYDFALAANPVRLLGNPGGGLTGPRLQRIVELIAVTQQSWIVGPTSFTGVQSLALLSPGTWRYYFTGTKLLFSENINNTLKLRYLGEPNVDWTKQTVGDNERIDDNEDYHDIIALLAAQIYAIRDGAFNAQLQARLAQRLSELQEHAYYGRDLSASTSVQPTYDP